MTEKIVTVSSATSHKLNSEENMMNLKDPKTRVTAGDSRTLTGTKHGDWHFYHRCDGKIHHLTLSNTAAIPGLHTNLFSVTRSLQKGFQVKSEGKTLILNKISTDICFDKKMEIPTLHRIILEVVNYIGNYEFSC